MEQIFEELIAFTVIGVIFYLIAMIFKSATGKDLSSETFEESKKELQKKVLDSKPANYFVSGLFPEENMQQHTFEEQENN